MISHDSLIKIIIDEACKRNSSKDSKRLKEIADIIDELLDDDTDYIETRRRKYFASQFNIQK